MRQYNTFDVNVVVGVGDGLVAPVVRDVGRKGLKSISDEVKALASSAQAQELEPHQVLVAYVMGCIGGRYWRSRKHGIDPFPSAFLS